MNELTLFLGRFHPLLVHFPIALLVLAGVCELCAWWGAGRTRPVRCPERHASPALSALGDSTGSVLSLGGPLRAGRRRRRLPARRERQLRRTDIRVARAAWRRGGDRRIADVVCLDSRAAAPVGRELTTAVYRTLLVTTIIVIAIAGHLGATLTHGEGYLTEHAPAAIRGWLGRGDRRAAAPVAEPSRSGDRVFDRRAADPGQALRQLPRPRPEPKASSGSTRLDGIRKGGEDGPVIVAGRAADSEIDPPYLAAPVAQGRDAPRRQAFTHGVRGSGDPLVDRSGRTGRQEAGGARITAEVEPAIEAAVGVVTRGGPSLPDVNVGPPDRQAVAAAARLGVSVVPLGASTHFIELHCTNAKRVRRQPARRAPAACTADGLAQPEWHADYRCWPVDGGAVQEPDAPASEPNAVSDRGLPQLAGLQHLEYLNLYGTGVSDAGLQSLAALKRLRTLYVWQTRVSDSGLERLRSALPRLEVDSGLALSSRVP